MLLNIAYISSSCTCIVVWIILWNVHEYKQYSINRTEQNMFNDLIRYPSPTNTHHLQTCTLDLKHVISTDRTVYIDDPKPKHGDFNVLGREAYIWILLVYVCLKICYSCIYWRHTCNYTRVCRHNYVLTTR